MHSLEPKNKVFLIEMLKLILRNESLKGEILVPVSICRHVRMKLYIYIYIHTYLVAIKLCFSPSGISVQISTYCLRSQEIALARG